MTKTITTCAGIGDSIWLFQKLINQPDKFNWRIPGGEPRRGEPLFQMFPSLVNSFDWVEELGYKTIKSRSYTGMWRNAPNKMYLQANTHLENGKRIEKFLPDLKTSFRLDPVITKEDQQAAWRLMQLINVHTKADGSTGHVHWNPPKLIGIYTSAYNTARHMGGWTAAEWSEFVRMLPPEYTLVFIGAPYDTGIVQQVMNQCNRPYIDTIGQPLGVVVEILKCLEAFCGFPSGLSILNELIGGKRTLMAYPPKLAPMQNTWADPERIESGAYKGFQWCEPIKIFNWMKANWGELV